MADGVLLPAVTDGPRYFCRNPEQFGDGTATFKLRTNRPTWWIEAGLPWMPLAKLDEVFAAAAKIWEPTADVKATRAASQDTADWLVRPAVIDGAGNVLANANLPNPTIRQQVLNIDVAESALIELMVTILGHEIGHLYGLQHFPSTPPPELMEPVLNPAIRVPQPTEASLMAQLYGLPKSEPTPGMPPLEPLVCTTRVEQGTGLVKCAVSVQQGQRKAELSGTKTW